MEIDLKILVAQACTFLAAAFILWRFAGAKLLAILDARRKTVSDGLADIDRRKKEAEELRARCDAEFRRIDEMRRELLTAAADEARQIKERAKEEAEREAKRITDQARERTRLELAKAQELVKATAVDVGMAAAEHILRKGMSAEVDGAVIKGFLERLEQDAGPYCG